MVPSRPFRPSGTEPPIGARWRPRDARGTRRRTWRTTYCGSSGRCCSPRPSRSVSWSRRSSPGAACPRRRCHRHRGHVALLVTVGDAVPRDGDPRDPARARLRGPVRADRHGPRPGDPVHGDVRRADGPDSVAAALRLDPPTAYRLEWDATGTRATLGPPATGTPTRCTRSSSAGARERRRRQPRRPAAQRRPHRHRRHGVDRRHHDHAALVRLDTSFRIRLDRALPARRGPGRPPGGPAVAGDLIAEPTAGDVPVRAVRHAGARHDLPALARGPGRRERRPVRRHDPVEVTTATRPRSPASARRPTTRGWPARRGLGPVHRADGRGDAPRRRLHVIADGKAVKGTVRWAEDGTRLCSRRRAPAVRREGRGAGRPVRAGPPPARRSSTRRRSPSRTGPARPPGVAGHPDRRGRRRRRATGRASSPTTCG